MHEEMLGGVGKTLTLIIEFKIMYRDEHGVWDGVLWDGRTVLFFAIRETDEDIAEPMPSESLAYPKTGTGNLIARIHGEHLFHLSEQLIVQLDLETSDHLSTLLGAQKNDFMILRLQLMSEGSGVFGKF